MESPLKEPDSATVPYFKTVKSFAEVSVTAAGVDTVAFLDASEGLVSMFDLLGSGIFSFVQADLRKNIAGVRERYSQFPSASSTLESLVLHEADDNHQHATGCLLRLLRGLMFTRTALKNSRDNKGEELSASFKRAYDTTLRHHHNFAVRTVVGVAIKTCPRRHAFYARIAQGGSQEALDMELGKWLAALGDILSHLVMFYDSRQYGRV